MIDEPEIDIEVKLLSAFILEIVKLPETVAPGAKLVPVVVEVTVKSIGLTALTAAKSRIADNKIIKLIWAFMFVVISE